MDEHGLRELIEQVKAEQLSRRGFVEAVIALGVTAPIAREMLTAAGVAHAQPTRPTFMPAKRGGGGLVKALWWAMATQLNPALAVGIADFDGCRIFYEPLASFDSDGNLVPVLAQDIPSVQNGGVARDGMSVTWMLKRGVTWHDGKPFTADDIVFTWEYEVDPTTGSPILGFAQDIARVEAVATHTVRFDFRQPTPFWAFAYCGLGMILPRHVFQPYKGAQSREAPANVKPVGTGPYRSVEFRPGDVIRAEINPNYHVPNRPFFETLEVKGGGDAVSAARAVLQTGEYDYATNLQVEDEILKRFEQGGKGRVDFAFGGNVEHIQLNQTDPWAEVDGERSSLKTTHPFLTEPAVRSAFNMLVDRASIHEYIYGRTGVPTANWLNAPSRFQSKNTRWEFNVDKANRVLDAAGWKRGSDGLRAKDGRRLKLLFQTATNSPRQKVQATVKQAAAQAGVEIELKSVLGSSFASSDPANADTFTHFYADIQLINYPMTSPDPQIFMKLLTSSEVPTKANKWHGWNTPRWRNDEYDRLFAAARSELDPVKRAALFIKMNDLVIQNVVLIPVAWRPRVAAISNRLRDAEQSAWDSDFWRLAHWHRAS